MKALRLRALMLLPIAPILPKLCVYAFGFAVQCTACIVVVERTLWRAVFLSNKVWCAIWVLVKIYRYLNGLFHETDLKSSSKFYRTRPYLGTRLVSELLRICNEFKRKCIFTAVDAVFPWLING
jgi:hypothetical protein